MSKHPDKHIIPAIKRYAPYFSRKNISTFKSFHGKAILSSCIRMYVFALLSVFMLVTGCGNTGGTKDETSIQKQHKQHADSCLANQEYIDAFNYYIKAVKEANNAGDSETYAAATCNIGIIYGAFRDFDKAKYYFEKAYKLADTKGYDKIASASAINLLLSARPDSMNNDFIKASEYYKKYSAYNNTSGYWDKYLEARTKIKEGDTEAARKLFAKARNIAEHEDLEEELRTMVYVDIAESWLVENRTDSAIKYYKYALLLNDGFSNQKREIYSKLNTIYMSEEQTDSLAKYQNLLLQLIDSIYDINKFNRTRNGLDEYEEQIVRNDMDKISGRLVISAIVCIVLLILLGIIAMQYIKRRESWIIMKRNYDSLLNEYEKSKIWRVRYSELKNDFDVLKASSQISASDNNMQPSDGLIPGINDSSDEETAPEDSANSAGMPFTLNDELRQRINLQIMKIVDDGETILDPDFSLNYMASILKINSKYISLTISETYNVNFKTFINRYRVDEVCRRLSDNTKYGNLTIAAIATECGFKSVSNFISIFKKQVGMSPKKYRDLAG